jgi:hypothetical protein
MRTQRSEQQIHGATLRGLSASLRHVIAQDRESIGRALLQILAGGVSPQCSYHRLDSAGSERSVALSARAIRQLAERKASALRHMCVCRKCVQRSHYSFHAARVCSSDSALQQHERKVAHDCAALSLHVQRRGMRAQSCHNSAHRSVCISDARCAASVLKSPGHAGQCIKARLHHRSACSVRLQDLHQRPKSAHAKRFRIVQWLKFD